MKVITVIPISRGIGKETLSYFTAEKVALGSLVEVPLRKKMISALVIEISDVRAMKTELRQADFSLRKVEKLVSKPFLSEQFMKTVEETAKWHAATIGATLNVLLHDGHHLTRGSSHPPSPANNTFSTKEYSDTFINRIDHYRKEITRHKNSIIVAPTKERLAALEKLFDIPIILPSSLIEIPLNTSLIIIEDTSSQAYKSISRPFIDFRFALEQYARHIRAKIIHGKEGTNPRIQKTLEEHKKEEGAAFSSIGKHLERDIKLLKGKTGHLFVLGTRKGHSGTVLCQDCGHIFKCTRCDAPLTLHLKAAKEDFNNMLCHHCGYKTSAMTGCPVCGGWRLKSYGLGIEKIEEDILALCKKFAIKAYVQRIDSTLKLTPKKIRDFIKTHYHKDRAILIGTEIVLPYLVNSTIEGKQNNSSYIASLDTLLSLPDFSINEKITRLIAELDDVSSEKVVIQTRNAKHPLLSAWKENTLNIFWQKELEERKAFNYPPHGVLIKITLRGKKESIAKEMKAITSRTEPWKPMVFPAFIKTVRNMHILHALIAFPKKQWVDEDLLSILRTFPPSVVVEVNPRSML